MGGHSRLTQELLKKQYLQQPVSRQKSVHGVNGVRLLIETDSNDIFRISDIIFKEESVSHQSENMVRIKQRCLGAVVDVEEMEQPGTAFAFRIEFISEYTIKHTGFNCEIRLCSTELDELRGESPEIKEVILLGCNITFTPDG